ncbi:MAG: archaeosortase/exosortase family protein [Chitinophagaceae bacterium]|nr:archaeosortase/exosortase family protein [Chitinophagaceae bacterium]
MKKDFIIYLLKFLLTFCVLYYGTIAMIGITSEGGFYSPFAASYLDYVSLLRSMLLHSSMALLHLIDYKVYLKDIYTIKLENGLGVHIGYDCIGYGVMFFWVAFIFANKGSLIKKLKWMAGGLLLIWIVNVLRISLMVFAVNEKWKTPLGLDNHTLFNIAAYTVIFTMIYMFDRAEKKEALADEGSKIN